MGVNDIIQEACRGTRKDWYHKCWDFERTYDATNEFSTVKDSGASIAIESDSHLGTLKLSSAATTDDDGALAQSIQEFVLPTSGKRFALRAKVKLADADQMDFFFGLSQKAATNPENILAASNRIGFQINDGDASILCKSEAADLETSKDSEQDAADATYVELGFHYNGAGTVSFEVNGSGVGAISSNIPATELAIALFHLSGDASGTKTSIYDFVEIAVER